MASLILRTTRSFRRRPAACALQSPAMKPRLSASKRSRMAELLDALAVREGTFPSVLPGVELTRMSQPARRRPVMYRPVILFIGQGRKRGFLGREVLRYDAQHYLALSVPVPVVCEIEASAQEPLLAVIGALRSIEIRP